MKTLIETYRGFEISFDTEKEIFHVQSDNWDTQENRKSFSSAKTWIDNYIKENIDFHPIVAIKIPSNGRGKIKLIGIRKDKRFIYTALDSDKKEQLSEYNEKDYVIYEPLLHDPILQEIEKIDVEMEKTRQLKLEQIKKFTGKPLIEIKNLY